MSWEKITERRSDSEMTVNVGAGKDDMVLFWTDIKHWIARLKKAGALIEREGVSPEDGETRSIWCRLPRTQVKLVLITADQAKKRSDAARKRALAMDLGSKMRSLRALNNARKEKNP